MKIAIINHTFQKYDFYKRWKILAEQHKDIEITLLAPNEWIWGAEKNLTFGSSEMTRGTNLDQDNFHIRTIDIAQHKFRSWSSKAMESVLCEINPDIIYFIGLHTCETIQDIITIRNCYLPNAKFIVFSMRGKYHTLRIKNSHNFCKQAARCAYYVYSVGKIKRLNRECDAIFCHYPDGMKEFIREGYTGPIYMQTQVGVDLDIFHPNKAARKKIRDKYQIADAYLLGSASRFNINKGLCEIIQALPKEGNWKYLMMGWGLPDEVNRIKSEIAAHHLEDKIILTGYIDNWTDMAEHWNALDCAIHTPLTSPEWEETFSLALVQAMATGLPVIGSSSGSVPYQIGEDGVIVKERDIDELRKQILKMIEHPEDGKQIGQKMFDRATKCFSTVHLNNCFYDTVMDIYYGVHDEKKIDMTQYLVR
jgi:glycosyltransferase involved in cell wall biosynthesis